MTESYGKENTCTGKEMKNDGRKLYKWEKQRE
jgi:hypothetical protein